MTVSSYITQNDLTGVLNEVLPTPRYGGVQTASWTANSSNANNVKLTDSLHLTAGTYVITLKYPAVSANLYTTLFYSRNGGSSTLLDSFTVSQGISCSSHTYVVNIPFELDLWAETATSTSITYTYKERGGLRAIQISESSTSDNEADYIVEQGTSGIWTYRKWNSGIAECWGTTSVPSTSYSANGGYKNVTETLPSGLFNVTPTVVTANGRIDSVIGTDIGFTAPNDTTSIQTYLINRYSSAVTKTGMVYWTVKGTWK